ncbi:MAG: hypothetical protein SNJ57_09370 [Cyanobacteriota bacterium]
MRSIIATYPIIHRNMEYFIYTAGAISIGWLVYSITHQTVRNTHRFWREQIQTRALFSRTIGRFFLTEDERSRTQLDHDQRHIDELLRDARESRDRLLTLTQWFADPTRTTSALDNLPGRTSRQLVDELARIDQDITQAIGQFQRNLKGAIASYTRGTNLVDRFEAMQSSANTQKANTTQSSSGTNNQVVVETTVLQDIADNIIYMVYYPTGNASAQMTGSQIKEEIARGLKINKDFFICGPAANFGRR